MQYKGKQPSTQLIGEELGVNYVLSGTVRWQSSPDAPSRVRVTPLLTEVSKDTSLWAEPYDAVLADINMPLFVYRGMSPERWFGGMSIDLADAGKLAGIAMTATSVHPESAPRTDPVRKGTR